MVGQIHNMFPELSIVWLLFGEGPMEIWLDPTKEKSQERPPVYPEGLFSIDDSQASDSKKIVFSSDSKGLREISQGEAPKNYSSDSQFADLKIEKLQNKIKELQGQIENLRKNPRKVSHITVYYEDSTFETFFPR